MGVEENKELARRFIEVANNLHGKPENIPAYINEFFAPEFVAHISTGDLNIEEFEEFERKIVTMFPEGHHTIDRLIAEDDIVVIQRTATTGQQSFRAADIFRIANGKFIEGWAIAEVPPPD